MVLIFITINCFNARFRLFEAELSEMNFSTLYITLLAFSFTQADWCNDDKIVIKTDAKVCEVSENFLSVAIDTHFIFKRNLNNLLNSFGFMNMLKGLKPAYLRIGGTAADLVTFDDKTNVNRHGIDDYQSSLMNRNSWDYDDSSCLKKRWDDLHLSREKWLSINTLASEAGLHLLFDLNVLKRLPSGKWDPDNASRLIRFSQVNNLTLDWQLGNEPNSFCHVFGQEVTPIQLARDYDTLSIILKKFPIYQKSKLLGPDITAPRGPKRRQLSTLTYLDKFLSKAKNIVSAATWHQYYISGRNATLEEFMSPSIMDVLKREIGDIKAVVTKNTNNRFPIWISETASAFGGGAPALSNRFVSGFMWLDKLGLAALNNISVVVRQSFIGGHYGLLDEKTLQPNTAFWVSYIYKKIVGTGVLKLETSCENPSIRLYAHCHKESGLEKKSFVIFGMNLGLSDYKGVIHVNNNTYTSENFDVEKYILMAADGHLNSRGVKLNGLVLELSSSQELPILQAIQMKTNSIILPPKSLGFFVVKNIDMSGCDYPF